MAKYVLDRRLFLRRSGTAVLAIGAGGMAVFRDPSGAWAITLDHLDASTAETLLQLARVLYPHDQLGDMYYAVVVEALDGAAEGDAEAQEQLVSGVARLDAAAGGRFVDLDPEHRTAVVAEQIGDPLVQKVRGTAVVELYNNPLVWPVFGYEGSSADEGGYIDRGFQDLGWLDAPSAEASPPAYRG
ncbi:MAG: tat (twin-arginine translocation) pathway signal sequence [Pseudomonadota bacterium]